MNIRGYRWIFTWAVVTVLATWSLLAPPSHHSFVLVADSFPVLFYLQLRASTVPSRRRLEAWRGSYGPILGFEESLSVPLGVIVGPAYVGIALFVAHLLGIAARDRKLVPYSAAVMASAGTMSSVLSHSIVDAVPGTAGDIAAVIVGVTLIQTMTWILNVAIFTSEARHWWRPPAFREAIRYLPLTTGAGIVLLLSYISSHRKLGGAVIAVLVIAVLMTEYLRYIFHLTVDLDRGNDERALLLSQVIETADRERRRIAVDLHDTALQGVLACQLILDGAEQHLSAGHSDRAKIEMGRIRTGLGGTADELRRLSRGLVSHRLAEVGLRVAIVSLRDELEPFFPNGVTLKYDVPTPIPASVEELVFRVVNEAMSNAQRHSGGSRVRVAVESSREAIQIEVGDDGRGVDVTQIATALSAGHLGFATMRERVKLAGGTFRCESSLGKGTTIMAFVPLARST